MTVFVLVDTCCKLRNQIVNTCGNLAASVGQHVRFRLKLTGIFDPVGVTPTDRPVTHTVRTRKLLSASFNKSAGSPDCQLESRRRS